MNMDIEDSRVEALYSLVQQLIYSARSNIARSINTEMVTAYWLIGKAIIEEEQHGADRAKYGASLIKSLSIRLSNEFGKGVGISTVQYIRQFYLTYLPQIKKLSAEQIHHSLSGKSEVDAQRPTFNPNLSWTHYRTLCKVQNKDAIPVINESACIL